MTQSTQPSRETLFERRIVDHLPRLMATALRLTRSRSDAEDLVADAVATGWRKLHTLDDFEALGAWLCRILINTFTSQNRSGLSKSEMEPYTEACAEAESFSLFERLHQPFLLWQSNPEQQFLDRILREDLEAAIDSLPEVFRTAVMLVDVEGMSYREASDALDVPVGTIRSRLARGRSQLQEALWTQAVDAGYRDRPEPSSGSEIPNRGRGHE